MYDRQMKPYQINTLVQISLKRLGKDERWVNYIGGTYETAQTIGEYKVEFSEPSKGATQIVIWNKVNPCISIYIADEEAILKHTAILSTLYAQWSDEDDRVCIRIGKTARCEDGTTTG